jgi:hypothetical protein
MAMSITTDNVGVAGESKTIRIGNKATHTATFIAGIYGVAVTGSQVVVNSSGKLGIAGSSARFKEAIKPMNKASETILALKPVTFQYKHELDPYGVPQFGLIAEQVEKVNPDLVVRDNQGRVSAVRYEAVNAMLLNEFLKEHRQVTKQQTMLAQQQSSISDLKAAIAQQQKQIASLNAGLQKMGAQVGANEAARRVALSNH